MPTHQIGAGDAQRRTLQRVFCTPVPHETTIDIIMTSVLSTLIGIISEPGLALAGTKIEPEVLY